MAAGARAGGGGRDVTCVCEGGEGSSKIVCSCWFLSLSSEMVAWSRSAAVVVAMAATAAASSALASASAPAAALSARDAAADICVFGAYDLRPLMGATYQTEYQDFTWYVGICERPEGSSCLDDNLGVCAVPIGLPTTWGGIGGLSPTDVVVEAPGTLKLTYPPAGTAITAPGAVP